MWSYCCMQQQKMAKYTKFCSAEVLKKCICTISKDQQQTHLMLAVFKRCLAWLETEYDRDVLLQAINCIELRDGTAKQEIEWIYVIEGRLWYHDMLHSPGQHIRFNQFSHEHITYEPQGSYAVLTSSQVQFLERISHDSQNQKTVKFLKESLFYPHYIEEADVRQFAKLVRLKRLSYNQQLQWPEDGCHKLALIYKGVVSIEHNWKRVIHVTQLTPGMCLTNRYIQDQLQQIQELALEPLDQPKNKPLLHYRYISKSNRTTVIMFNLRLINQAPYDVNIDLKPRIKKQYEQLALKINNIMENQEDNHPSKKEIKQQVRRNLIKENVRKQFTRLDQSSLSPVVRTYKEVERRNLRFHTISHHSETPMRSPRSNIAPSQPSTPKITRAKTTLIRPRPGMVIHNTWIQSNYQKKPKSNTKSFSTLKNLKSLSPKALPAIEPEEEPKSDDKGGWYVAQQFVKQKLRLQYQGLVKKLRKMQIKEGPEETRTDTLHNQMRNLQDEISSKRIVRVNNLKVQQKMLRNRILNTK